MVVLLLPGRYELAAPLELTGDDSGTPAAPIVYRAAKRGTAVLSGGVELGGWQPVTGSIVSCVGHAVTTCGNANVVESNIAINSRKSSFELSGRGIDTSARANAQKGAEGPMIVRLIDKRKP